MDNRTRWGLPPGRGSGKDEVVVVRMQWQGHSGSGKDKAARMQQLWQIYNNKDTAARTQ